MSQSEAPKRVPVDYRYDAINPAFLKMLARIGSYADAKYGHWEQYTQARLTGEKSPVNHISEHLRAYTMGEPYDHFDGDPRWHLAAIAYNAMMAFWYHSKWGPEVHPLHIEKEWLRTPEPVYVDHRTPVEPPVDCPTRETTETAEAAIALCPYCHKTHRKGIKSLCQTR